MRIGLRERIREAIRGTSVAAFGSEKWRSSGAAREELAMHVLELSDTDTVILRKAVETRLREMREELVRTDDRAYRDGLKSDLNRLEGIGRIIGATVESEKTLY